MNEESVKTKEVLTKICSNPECHLAGIEQALENFYKHERGKYGRRAQCKVCRGEKALHYRSKPGIITNKAIYDKKYKLDNKDHIAKLSKKYRSLEEVKASNRHKRRIQRSTLRGRLHNNISCGIRNSLGSKKAGRSWESLVGYTIDDLISHLDALVYPHPITGEEMDFGTSEIDIHHVIPQACFDFETEQDPGFKECWALTNLVPLWRCDHKAINHFDLIKVYKENKEG